MICGSTVLVMAGQGVVGPVLPLFARNFGVSTAVVGLTFTAFGLARLVLNVPAGIVADRRGRRVLLVGGPLITAIGMIGSGLAPTIWVLLGWRLVAGAGSALYMTGAQIYLIDIAADDQRARYIATNQAALLLGVSAGPAFGGLLAESFSLRTPFFVVGVGALLTTVYSYLRLPETVADHRSDSLSAADESDSTEESTELSATADGSAGAPQTRRDLLRSSQFLAVAAISFAVFGIRAGYRQTLVPLAAAERFGFDTGDIGLLFAAVGALGLITIGPAGWAADRFGRRPVIIGPSAVAIVGVLLTAAAGTSTQFIVANVVAAFGTSITGPAPSAFVADLAPAHLRGAAMGLYRTAGDLGIVVAPLLSGALADRTSLGVGMTLTAAILAIALVWFVLVAREQRPYATA